nr:MAG TPA: hypothetical protein [Caudoviricetes sp.]
MALGFTLLAVWANSPESPNTSTIVQHSPSPSIFFSRT